ncbi:hypothetical protein GGX14DRAFT_410493 [Mycena pura]|uniref:BTB domain-containing protein n=1 Tax=Mycena pura TaxID=153505 RepID=A0AAD6YV27_9AGAR|nr:hypothetical protein GGX14DRAFT_410493 [Mycena pura]
MDVDTKPDKPQRVEALWFEDGNIILQAGTAQYRVYRGTLARESDVFKDMLSFPQPPESELVDGCPLVILPDAEVEVTPFLRALFDPTFFQPFPALTNFKTLYGCLRLGHKYEVDYLRRRALVHLSSNFRTRLVEWDSAFYSANQLNRLPSDTISWPFPKDRSCLICVIQLARETEALWVLPETFYTLSSTRNYIEVGGKLFHCVDHEGILASLSKQDQESVMMGARRQTASTADVLAFLGHPHRIDGCESPQVCSLRRFRVVGEGLKMVHDFPGDPLIIWDESDWNMLDVCDICLGALKRIHAAARQSVWDSLPGMYGLPPWNELEQMREAAIGTDMSF